MQAAFPGAQQESDEDGKGEDAVAGEIFGVDAMLGDEGGLVERLREIGEDDGMDTAKSGSLFILIYQWIMVKHYTTFLNLTALGLTLPSQPPPRIQTPAAIANQTSS